jgi:hypothetical protein
MRKIFVIYTCVLVLFLANGRAQPAIGTISGKIISAAGKPIPNAAVTITNTGTNQSQKLLTGPDGTFTISGLMPGTYKVEAEAAGFQPNFQQGVEVMGGSQTHVNLALQPANSKQAVAATGTTSQIQEDNAEISMALGTRQVRELPIQDRNYQELAGLMTGITPPLPTLDLVTDPDRNRLFSTNGQAPDLNINQLDGLLNLEPFTGIAVRVVPVETIATMNIVTANFTEEKGFVAGALLNEITRSGTNEIHGSLFEFNSGNWSASRNFFNIPDNPKPRFVYNQFGGTVGGPVVKNKTFLFGSYQGTFENGGITQLATVPTPAALMGNFSGIPGVTIYNPFTGFADGTGRTAFAGNVIPSLLINPTSAAIASFLPAPNAPGFFNNYVSNVPYKNNDSKVDARLDQHFTDRTSAFVRWGYSNFWAYQDSPYGSVLGAGSSNRLLAQNALADVTHVFSPSLVTEVDFGYNRYDQKLNTFGNQALLGDSLGVPLTNNLIGINIAGLSPIGAPAFIPSNPVDNTFNGIWSWSWRKGMNNFKWGVEGRRFRSDRFLDTYFGSLFGPNGNAYFGPGTTLANPSVLTPYSEVYNSLAGFLLGTPNQIGISNNLNPPYIRQTLIAGWFGDTIQVFHHVTLDLGVRWEAYSPLEAANAGGRAIFNPLDDTFSYTGIGSVGQPYSWNKAAVAPRVGFAWSINDKTVVRGGYGIHFFQEPYQLSGFMAPVAGLVSGVAGQYSIAPLSGAFGPTLTNPALATAFPLTNGTSADNLPATVIPNNRPQSYVQNYSIGVQRDFYYGTMLGVSYVGTLGRQLPYIEQFNGAFPGTGVLGLPLLPTGRTATTLFYGQSLTSNYNSLQVVLNKRYSKEGLSFTSAYTYGKALGYTTGNGLLLNQFNLASNYGPLSYDRQNMLTISHLWEMPFGKHGNSWVSSALRGWELNGIFTWATGTPLTFTSDPVTCDCPNTIPGATFVPGIAPYLNSGTQMLNPAAFTVPAAGTYGSLSRGFLRGPSLTNYNLSVFKNFKVRDKWGIELRAEAYNLANTPHFANPITNVSAADFGQFVSTIPVFPGASGRVLNLAARITF